MDTREKVIGQSVLRLEDARFLLGQGRFVACAAYGDGGPWYLPTKEAYPQGGYEVSVAWCDAGVDDVLTQTQRFWWSSSAQDGRQGRKPASSADIWPKLRVRSIRVICDGRLR